MTIQAVYEGGVFRPTADIDLAEGTHVEVIVPQDDLFPDPRAAAAKLAAIAALAPKSGTPETGSIDHDHYLYGAPRKS